MSTKSILTSAALALTLTAGTHAVAGTSVSATYPDSIVNALQDMGYKADIDIDDYGDPIIFSAAVGATLVIEFYVCDDGANCRDLHLTAGFDMPDGMSLSSMNDWNLNKRIGQAFLDEEKDPIIQHYMVNVDGMSRESFETTFEYWVETVEEFTDFIGW